jgi:hypothetical protein
VETVVELLGAALILSAFTLAQMGRLETSSFAYLVLNVAGAGILAAAAAVDGDIGFLVLEGVWTAVSAYGLVRLLLRR